MGRIFSATGTTDGTSRIDLSAGQLVPWTTFTIGAIFKVNNSTIGGSGREYVLGMATTTPDHFGIRLTTAGLTIYYEGNVLTVTPTMTFPSTEGYVFLSVSCNNTTTITINKYVYSTNTWTASTATSTAVAAGVAIASAKIGQYTGSNDAALEGEVHCVAQWNVALSTAQIQDLPFSLSSWFRIQPRALWLLDQAATTTAVVDLTGGGSNQTGVTGTTVGTTSVPLFSMIEEAQYVTHQLAVPSTNAPAVDTAVQADAYDATVAVSVNAEQPGVAVDAPSPIGNDSTTNTGQAAVTVAAFDAVGQVAISAPAIDAAVSADAQTPVVSSGINAGQAAVTSDGQNATVALVLNANALDAAVSADAQAPTPALGTNAVDTAVAVTGYDATVSTAATTNAPAVDTAVAVAAYDTSVSSATNALDSAVTADALLAAGFAGVNTGQAAVAVAAFDAVGQVAILVPATDAAVAVTGYDATVTTNATTNAPAVDAAVAVAAYDASIGIGPGALDCIVVADALVASIAGTAAPAQADVAVTAYDATASTSATANAPATDAAVTVTGFDATVQVAISAPAGQAAVAVDALQPVATAGTNASGTDVAVAAYDATTALAGTASPAQVDVAVTAYDATVSTATSSSAPALDAAVTVAALDAVGGAGASAGQAAVTAAAQDATVSIANLTNAPALDAVVATAAYDALVVVTANAGGADVAATASAAAAMAGINTGFGSVTAASFDAGSSKAALVAAETAYVGVDAITPPPPGVTSSPNAWQASSSRPKAQISVTRGHTQDSSTRPEPLTSGGERLADL